jgi:8-oxo-dGTP diphosphatase
MAAGRVEVVAAVIQRDDGQFLLGERPSGKVYAGYWEFPGGKVEPGESPLAALGRELNEELGITVERAYPWLTRDYDYAHAAVRLRFHRVLAWSGELHGRENQRFEWQRPGAVAVEPMLPANGPILKALTLPLFTASVCAKRWESRSS